MVETVVWKCIIALYVAAEYYAVCKAESGADYNCTDKIPDKYYVDLVDPSYFYTCVGSTALVQQCNPTYLAYYEDRGYCDYPDSTEEVTLINPIDDDVQDGTVVTSLNLQVTTLTAVVLLEAETTAPSTTVPLTTVSSTTVVTTKDALTTEPETAVVTTEEAATTAPSTTVVTTQGTTAPETTEDGGSTILSTTDSIHSPTTKDGVNISSCSSLQPSTRVTQGVTCEAETPDVSNIYLTAEPDSIIFSTSTDNTLKEDGPFKVVASLTVLQENTHLETVNGELLPSASDIVNIDIYDKYQKKISVGCDIKFPVIMDVTRENNANVNQIPVCHFTQDNYSLAVWSTEGCLTVHEDEYLTSNVTCKCTHLTSFVILMKPKQINKNKILSVLTNIGVAISCVFLIITLVIICGFKDLRNSDRYRILRHLVIAVLCVNFFFSSLEIDVKNISITCSLLAGCLHYSLLAAFSWMLIMSTDVYMKIKHPFADHERRFSYSRYIGWIAPVIVVGATAVITRENYASDKCWLDTRSGAIWAFISPVCLILLIVLVQLVVIGYIAFKKSQLPNQTEEEMRKLNRIRTLFRGILLLTPAVGLSWIFGVIIVFDNSEVMAYIFVILNSMQGFFIWLSQCVLNQEVRKALRCFSNRIRQE